MDPRRFSGLRRGSLNSKDGQSTRNDGSMFSLVLSSSPKVTFLMYLMRIRIHGCCWGSIVKDAVKSIVVNVPALCYENLVFSTFNGLSLSFGAGRYCTSEVSAKNWTTAGSSLR
ncbi:hypothetical protein ACFX11_035775 [Malus domestica]